MRVLVACEFSGGRIADRPLERKVRLHDCEEMDDMIVVCCVGACDTAAVACGEGDAGPPIQIKEGQVNRKTNTVYIPGVGDFLTRPTGHPHDPTTPEQEDEISSAMDVTSEVRALLREADGAIVRRDMVGFRAAMQVAQEYLSGMKF